MRSSTSWLGLGALLVACAPVNSGVPGDPAVTDPAIDGTVFTIVFENENADTVIVPANETFYELATTYANAVAYSTDLHPSLVNYIVMTSGETHGITTSDDPPENITIEGTEHLAAQLEAAGVPWRAYMESMGEPCRLDSDELYRANHDPFVYYRSLTDDPERCRERVVDLDAHLEADLAANDRRFMFIVPNQCNNMHNCPADVGDAWLREKVDLILASDGYRDGGALFILFDEGYLRILDAGANIPAIVVSERLRERPLTTDTRFDHRSYLATVQDIFGLPRLDTTEDAVPMSEVFLERDR